jgi:hypothetical protein
MRVMRVSLGGAVLWLLAVLLGCGFFEACSHTPSYNDIKVDKGGGLANANTGIPQTAPSQGPATPLAPDAGSLSPLPDLSASAEQSASPIIPPSSLDQRKGRIRDLPLYPGAKVRRLQYGPISGVLQVSIQAVTRAPFERVVAFYDQAVKDNRWIIDDNSRDADSYIWQLSRGQTDHGAVRIDRGQMGRVFISLARN